jgi:hypothetical protein
VDGPDIDGHQLDYDSAINRGRMYTEQEKQAKENHVPRLTGGNN